MSAPTPCLLTILAHSLTREQVVELVARSLIHSELEFSRERLADQGENAITDPDERRAFEEVQTDPEYLTNVVTDTLGNVDFEQEVAEAIKKLAQQYVTS